MLDSSLDDLRVVLRDDGFRTDTVRLNADRIFARLSPGTDVSVI